MPDSLPRLAAERLDTGVAHERAGSDRFAAAHRLAALVLAEMREHAIPPTPRNYDLWFTFRADMSPALAQRVRLALDEGQALTPAVLDTLHCECVAGADGNVDAIGCQSDAIQDAAQTFIEQVASNQAAVARYGGALTDWAQHLGKQPMPSWSMPSRPSRRRPCGRAGATGSWSSSSRHRRQDWPSLATLWRR